MYKLTGKESLGIELGSTRIKAVLTDEKCNIVAQGSHTWENKFENGFWTYSLEAVQQGLRSAFSDLNKNTSELCGQTIESLGYIGISAMMHGYIAFDKNDNLLVPFRTWRNCTTGEASEKLTKLFDFNIPQRWSVAHLYQAILNKEEHVKDISYIITLAGYVHYVLTGKRNVSVGEASGIFPIDSSTKQYNKKMLAQFSSLDEVKCFDWNIEDILPNVLLAGEKGGMLTKEGAEYLDESGKLKPGAIFCPAEGDAGTGMVATNSIKPKTGNVSAGTSIFSMVVLENPLKNVHDEIDIVTTPVGDDVAMVHCNNCLSDIDRWIAFFDDTLRVFGVEKTKSELYDMFYVSALNGSKDCGGITMSGLFSGEPVAHLDDGMLLLKREKNANFNLSNLARAGIYSAMAVLSMGHRILEEEGVLIDYLNGHGGLFKTAYVGQKLMAGALNCDIRVSKTAAEGGAWGAAVLANFVSKAREMSLSEYLENEIFVQNETITESPDKTDTDGFEEYMRRFTELIKTK